MDALHVHTICHNEGQILPYYLQHYSFADRIVLHDNGSTDETRRIVRGLPRVEVREYDSGGSLRDDLHTRTKNSMWKESRGRARWVAVVDADEFLHHPHLMWTLGMAEAAGVSLLEAVGYQMASETFPVGGMPLVDFCRRGYRTDSYSKLCLLRPDAVQDINYGPGCHWCTPASSGLRAKSDAKLLHYSHLGRDQTWQRTVQRQSRLSEENRRRGWGHQYGVAGREEFDAQFDEMLCRSWDVFSEDIIV